MQAPASFGTGRTETTTALTKAERLVEAHRYEDAIEALGGVNVPSASDPELALRVLHCEAWARLYLGDVVTAEAIAERARALSEGAGFSDLERAESLFRLGCCRLKLTRVSNAVSLFTLALRLGESGGIASHHQVTSAFDPSPDGEDVLNPSVQGPTGQIHVDRVLIVEFNPFHRGFAAGSGVVHDLVEDHDTIGQGGGREGEKEREGGNNMFHKLEASAMEPDGNNRVKLGDAKCVSTFISTFIVD